jgi:hypothetical protein
VAEVDARDLLQADFLRCQQPPRAGDEVVLAVQQDRIGEPELLDARGGLGHLLVRVGAGVPSVRDQVGERPALAHCDTRTGTVGAQFLEKASTGAAARHLPEHLIEFGAQLEQAAPVVAPEVIAPMKLVV